MSDVLLIIGAMGTGKSDASYHVFSRLYAAGVPEAMAAAWNVFQQHGARCLVVSGALDTVEAIESHVAQIPDATWTITRLRIAPDERRRGPAARAAAGRLRGVGGGHHGCR